MSSVLAAGDASPLHVHSREDEIFLLIQGRAAVWAGDDRYEVGPGGVAFLPKDLPHAYRVLEDGTQMLTLCTPAGLEGFFRGAGHDLSTPVPEDWSLGPAQLAPVAAAHGVMLLGPPPVS
jgi:quercetin dioxygenase-like cupin family protein